MSERDIFDRAILKLYSAARLSFRTAELTDDEQMGVYWIIEESYESLKELRNSLIPKGGDHE